MTVRLTTISSLVVAALSLGVAGGVALAAEDSPPSQSPGAPTSGHPSVLTDTECSGVWKTQLAEVTYAADIRPVAT